MTNPTAPHRARLFRAGRDQALRIPRDLEMPGPEVVLHREGARLVVEPVAQRGSLAELLGSWGPDGEEFPVIQDPRTKAEDVL